MVTAFINFVIRNQANSGVTNNHRFQVIGGFK